MRNASTRLIMHSLCKSHGIWITICDIKEEVEVLGHEERFIVIFNDVDSRKVYPNVVAKWFGFECFYCWMRIWEICIMVVVRSKSGPGHYVQCYCYGEASGETPHNLLGNVRLVGEKWTPCQRTSPWNILMVSYANFETKYLFKGGNRELAG